MLTRPRTGVASSTLVLTHRWLILETPTRAIVCALADIVQCEVIDYVNGFGLNVREGALKIVARDGGLQALVKDVDVEVQRRTFTRVACERSTLCVVFSQVKSLFGTSSSSGGAIVSANNMRREIEEMRAAAIAASNAHRRRSTTSDDGTHFWRNANGERMKSEILTLWAATNCLRQCALRKACGARTCLLYFSATNTAGDSNAAELCVRRFSSNDETLQGELCPPPLVEYLSDIAEVRLREINESHAFDVQRFKAELQCFSRLFIIPVKDLFREVNNVMNWRSPTKSIVCFIASLSLVVHNRADALPALFLVAQVHKAPLPLPLSLARALSLSAPPSIFISLIHNTPSPSPSLRSRLSQSAERGTRGPRGRRMS